jgi:RNA polymerase sigma-70 factor (ECF subfamily)
MQTPNNGPTESGHHAAIEEELVALLPKLKVHALYLTRSGDKADDLLQRTCLRALSRSHQWQAGTRLDRWASTIMDSIWFNELRQKRQRQEQELPEPDLVADRGFESDVEAQLMVSDIRRACTKLSDEDFVLVTKIHAYGYTYREIADELGVPIGTVLSRVSRAKAVIKRAADELHRGGRA